MKEAFEPIIKGGIKILEKNLEGKSVNLYELEEMVFQTFQAIQKAVFEKATSSLLAKKTSKCRHCSKPISELTSKGVRKKNS